MKGISAINELNQKGELNANRAGGKRSGPILDSESLSGKQIFIICIADKYRTDRVMQANNAENRLTRKAMEPNGKKVIALAIKL